MASKILLEIVAARNPVLKREVDSLRVPGTEGEFGILPGHAPIISDLGIGVVRYNHGGKMTKVAISGGFLEMYDNQVTILAETAESKEDIDVARARRARERAMGVLAAHPSEKESVQAEIALRRALARLKAAE